MKRKKKSGTQIYITASDHSVVICGGSGNQVTVGNINSLTEQEQELLRIFRALPMRQKVELLSICYDIHDGTEGNYHAVNTEKDH